MTPRNNILATTILCLIATASTAHDNHQHSGEQKAKKIDVEQHHNHQKAKSDILIHKEWIRSTAPGAPTTAAYLVLVNTTKEDITLTEAKSTIAERVEIHEHSMRNGVMKMQKVNGVLVPKESSVSFKPGGYHIMFIGLKDSVNEGDKISLTLEFDNNIQQTIEVTAKKKADESKHKHH